MDTDRRDEMIAALVEDMIRLAPLIPLRQGENARWRAGSTEDDVRGWAQDLALLANFLYDAAEAAVDVELSMAPQSGKSIVPLGRGHSSRPS